MLDYKKYNEDKYKKDYWTITRSKYKWFSNYVKLKVFKKWSSEIKDRRVFLDAGGGVGNWAFHFLDDFDKVVVLDISAEALKRIPEKEIQKKQGSILEIPFKSKFADCILLADVFEHILPKDLDKMLCELNRVLKDDGRVIIFTSHWGHSLRLDYSRLTGKMKGRIMESEIEDGHVNRMTFEEMKLLFEKNGFEVERVRYYGIFFQYVTEFPKNFAAKFIDFFSGKNATRKGQVVKDKLKRIEEPSLLFRTFFGLISEISYLDLFLGKFIRGDSIFLKIKKTAR